MTANNKQIYQVNFSEEKLFFDRKKIKYWLNEMFEWLFCTQKKYQNYHYFEQKEEELTALLIHLLLAEQFTNVEAEIIVSDLFANCVELHRVLSNDLDAIFECDPAAKSKNEVLIAYPGFYTITVHRIANKLWNRNAKILARLMSEYAHSKTGIDIHPAASIGEHFLIDHGTGIVIGETAQIGQFVKIYQGVTLGALTVEKNAAEDKRHPTIEDNVTIYANATILGGKTVIGKGSVIGGNVWITSTIPPQSLVYHKSEVNIKNREKFPEAINFVI